MLHFLQRLKQPMSIIGCVIWFAFILVGTFITGKYSYDYIQLKERGVIVQAVSDQHKNACTSFKNIRNSVFYNCSFEWTHPKTRSNYFFTQGLSEENYKSLTSDSAKQIILPIVVNLDNPKIKKPMFEFPATSYFSLKFLFIAFLFLMFCMTTTLEIFKNLKHPLLFFRKTKL